MCWKLFCLISFVLVLGLAADVVSGQEVLKINFQPQGFDIPEGYLPDFGERFADRGNGYIYGWDSNITGSAHDRAGTHSEQRYDTNIEMQDPVNSTWEIQLPDGIYDIFLVCGDAYYDDHVSNMDVEGNILIDPDGRGKFDEYNVTVLVQDGRLTIQPAPGAIKTGLVFTHITRIEMFKAYGPDPKDGSIYPRTLAILSWLPGDAAVSHNVYLGDNFDDVNNGTQDTFQGNQTDTSFIDVLIPDKTYYWRIDEVNESHPDSPWKGDVWSFKIAGQTAYDPDPPDGATMVELDVTLSWTAGIGAGLHHVYLGTDEGAVENATTTSPECMDNKHVATSYKPEPEKITIEKGNTYYWRIDEFDGVTTHKGDVWSFTTIPLIPIEDPNHLLWWKFGEGLDTATTAFDYSGYDHHGVIHGTSLVLQGRIGEARDFYGTTGDYVVDEDAEDYINGLSAVTVCMWIKANEIGTNRGFINSEEPARRDDYGVAMRYDSAGYAGGGVNVFKMVVRTRQPDFTDYAQRLESSDYVQSTEWQHVAMTWSSGEVVRFYINASENKPTFNDERGQPGSTVIGCTKLIIGKGGEPGATGAWNGLIDDVRIYNKALIEDDIGRVMIGEPDLAWNPSPANGSTPDLHRALPLSWSPGELADQHDVYFGTDRDAVANADISDATNTYRGRQDANSYTPDEGVEWGTGPYYWRIDEYNTNGTISKGRIWQFTVADFILVDDFENYDSNCVRVYYNWRDGEESQANPPCGVEAYSGNGTGAVIGHDIWSIGSPHYQGDNIEKTIVHEGGQSMPYYYDNNKQEYLEYSEAKMTLSYPRDWTEHGVKALALWFWGYAAGFKEGPAGTYTMTASGEDIWDEADDFRFAYKLLSGAGSIEAQVLSVRHTHDHAKTGVMIRRTLDPSSPYAAVLITPGGLCRFNYRTSPGGDAGGPAVGETPEGLPITAPFWVRLERDSSSYFNGYYSSDGVNWHAFDSNPQFVAMFDDAYVGLALTSHNINAICKAKFSDVTITGSVTPDQAGAWTDEVIGTTTMLTNDAEPMYVAIANNTGTPVVVYHDDPDAAQIDTWTEWNIDLKDFEDKGINLADVNSIAIGLGDRDNPQAGGSGLMYFDDIRLYRPRCVPDKLTLSEADLNSDCVVDFRDLETMAGDWLAGGPDLAGDLNADSAADFKDYAVLADQWLEEKLWP